MKKRGPPRAITTAQVATDLRAGLSPQQIADAAGVSKQTIYTRMRELREAGDECAHVGASRPSSVSAEADRKRRELHVMLADSGTTVAEAAAVLSLSPSAIRRHLQKIPRTNSAPIMSKAQDSEASTQP